MNRYAVAVFLFVFCGTALAVELPSDPAWYSTQGRENLVLVPGEVVVQFTSSDRPEQLHMTLPTGPTTLTDPEIVGAESYRTFSFTVAGLSGEGLASLVQTLWARPDVAFASARYRQGEEPYIPSSGLFVALNDAEDLGKLEEAQERLSLVGARRFGHGEHVYHLHVSRQTPRHVIDVALQLHEEDWVAWSHPDFIVRRVPRYTPNDPQLGSQWHHNNTGASGGLLDADIDAIEAWDVQRGDGNLIVAVIDTGVDGDHEDLADNWAGGRNVLDDTNDPFDDDGHGTACAGLIAAVADNSLGGAGVAHGCKIYGIRLIPPSGLVLFSDEAEAFQFAFSSGAGVVSNSWGPVGFASLPFSTQVEMDNLIDNGRGGLGSMIFFASGNLNPFSNLDDDGYANYERNYAVGAVTNLGDRAAYSEGGSGLDFVAPSNGGTLQIFTTFPGDTYGSFGGTSAACPIAAGVAALLLSERPDLNPLQAASILKATADKVGSGYDGAGHSTGFGFGRVNAEAAVLSTASPVPAFSLWGLLLLLLGVPTAMQARRSQGEIEEKS